MAQLKRFGFGLQALIAMASDSNQWSSVEIADHIHCEPTALRKILSQLAEAGLLEVKQGRTGGYRLIKRPDEITLSEVYKSVYEEEPQWDRMLDTTDEGLFGTKVQKSFHKIMADITMQVDFVLRKYTIADMIE
jgi:Rrf2 family protein